MSLSDLFPSYPSKPPLILPPPVIPKIHREDLPEDQKEALKKFSSELNDINRLHGLEFILTWKTLHAARMNKWYMEYIEISNTRKIEAYLTSYENWKQNMEIINNMQHPVPYPKMPDPPVLEDVKPKPVSFWFS